MATVITKWKANDKYSFGYVRAETLAGFINGLFLLFISFFIFSEAVERLVEPPEVKHERLLVVSVLGFLVNLVGIFVFQHGGAGHGHSHDGGHGHSHDGGHGHSHGGGGRSQIMQGVFLHILADTLGSLGVISEFRDNIYPRMTIRENLLKILSSDSDHMRWPSLAVDVVDDLGSIYLLVDIKCLQVIELLSGSKLFSDVKKIFCWKDSLV